jgi:hypothetical protein
MSRFPKTKQLEKKIEFGIWCGTNHVTSLGAKGMVTIKEEGNNQKEETVLEQKKSITNVMSMPNCGFPMSQRVRQLKGTIKKFDPGVASRSRDRT